jgi:hypothetical protein
MTIKILLLLYVFQALLHSQVLPRSAVTTQKGEILTAPRSSAATTGLLFPYATTADGSDTEITISNTSQDTMGSVA